jgi:hypothetical protein
VIVVAAVVPTQPVIHDLRAVGLDQPVRAQVLQGRGTAGKQHSPLWQDGHVDPGIREFDGKALYAAVDAKRQAEGLSWPRVATAIWEMAPALNRRRRAAAGLRP